MKCRGMNGPGNPCGAHAVGGLRQLRRPATVVNVARKAESRAVERKAEIVWKQELKAIADKICAHFDLTPVGVNIAEQEQEINGRYVPQLACAPAQILISSTHDPCCSMEDILLHELAHHLQHNRDPGSMEDHDEDFLRAILDVVIAHYGDPIEYDWLFDCVSDGFSGRLREMGIDV